MRNNIFPVILCGGAGTRLWPLSRAMYPKQFIPLINGTRDSLLAQTLTRLAPGDGFLAPTMLCNEDYRFLLTDELDRAGIQPREILLEPVARSTAPAIAVAAMSVVEEQADGVLVVMPSDHAFKQPDGFPELIDRAAELARRGHLVLFGVEPDSPHTGYGYIRKGAPLGNGESPGFKVEAFVEKPDEATAQGYLTAGDHFWNSGIFVLPAQLFLEEAARHEPDMTEHARAALAASQHDLGFRRLGSAAYAQCPTISIDHAVMERTDKAAMLPMNAGWSDIGSWSALWETAPQDENGNAVHGDAMLMDTRNSYVHAENALVSTLGVDDLIIVHTPDAMLVANRDRAKDVDQLVAQLKRSNRREHEQHVRNYRPWGFFQTLSLGPRFQVKLLHVKPGAQLSLQMHHHRSEHWTVVSGTALVVRDDEEQLVCENESIYISATQWHRLENPGKVPLEVIEVQIGGYLGEDDIVRSHDIYQRAAHETK